MKNKLLLILSFLILTITSVPVWAQDNTDDDQLLEEVVVLGSRRDGRTATQSMAPVDVIGSDLLEAAGFTQTIRAISAVLPSFTAAQSSINDGTDYVRPATLRGLGPEHVLVLVNGKRRHASALVHVNSQNRGSIGVDLNTIPANMIERIEVLRDGAAAQYGSDAIAGVMNIVLKKSTDFNVSVSYGSSLSWEKSGYAAGEGLVQGGNTDADYNSGMYLNNWATGGNQEERFHTDGQSTSINLGKGFKIGKDGGVIYVAGQFRRQERTNRAGKDPRMQYFGTLADGSLSTDANAVRADNGWDAREAGFDRLNHWYGQGKLTDINVSLNGEIPQRDGKDLLYFNTAYSYRIGVGPCYYRRALDNRTVRSKYPDGFLPQIFPVVTDFVAGFGYKAKLDNGWNIDASTNLGRSSFNFRVTNTQNTSLGNFGASNPLQKTQYDNGTLAFLQWNTNVDVSKTVDIGVPLNVAFGGEIRYEQFTITPGEEGSFVSGPSAVLDGPNLGASAAAGCQCFPGYQNFVDKSRLASAVYLDLESDLSDKITMGVAGRFENYSDFGSTINGKFSFRWQFSEPVAFRATASTGFRAPGLQQAFYSAVATNAIAGVLIESGTFPVDNPVAVALGAKTLQAEKSVNLSAGITAKSNKFKLTLDGYYITLMDRVVLSEDFQGIERNGVNLLEQFLATRGVSAQRGRFFTNALDTRTYGVDLVATYNFVRTESLKFDVVLAGNYTVTEITNEDDIETPALLAAYSSTPILGDFNRVRVENYNPKAVVNLTLNLDYKNWSLMFRTTYYGEVTNPSETGNSLYNQVMPATVVNSIEIGHKFGADKKFHVAIGSNNLFDIYPQKTNKEDSFNGVFQYGASSPVPMGFNGRFVYGRISLKL